MKIRVRDVDVYYEETGSGRPMLVLHGGAPIGCGAWARGQHEPLFENRKGWRFIYPDQLGHGRTPAPEWLTHHDQAVDFSLAFMDAVAPNERWVVTGVSWGGYLARGVIHHRLNALDGMFIWVAPHIWQAPHLKLEVLRHTPEFDTALRPEEEWLRNMMPIQTLSTLEHMRRTLFVGAGDSAGLELFDFQHPFSFDPDHLSEPFRAPALIIAGRQDAVVGHDSAIRTVENFPRGTHVVLDACGHLMAVDQFNLLKVLANEWLDRVEDYVAERAGTNSTAALP